MAARTAHSGLAHPPVAFVGAGAIGSRLAARLADGGVECVLFDEWDAHVDAINRDGLHCTEGGCSSLVRVAAYPLGADAGRRFERVIVAVRSDRTEAVAPFAAGLLEPEGALVSCQNGINESALARVAGAGRTFGCALVYGARLTGPGRVEALPGDDTFKVGAWDAARASGPALDRLVDLFSLCGRAIRTDDLPGYRWMKLVLNAMGNPLLLLSGQTAAQLHADPLGRSLMAAIAREVLAAAAASGVSAQPPLEVDAAVWLSRLPQDEAAVHARLARHGQALGGRRLSMVADFHARGRTEVDHINGLAARTLRAHGRPAPLNEAVVALVHELESGRRPISPDNLRELAARAEPALH